ncbi:MAG: tetratricopeptide repeat protein [Acutalibacteraceae bacterium]
MRCPRCDANVSDTATLCTFCGQNLSVIHYIRRVSNTYYNLGLEKAKVRDLSGAIVVLKKSLEFNKKNTNARNLLGLIYYEMGETVAALSEWVLSKYLQADDNAADYYINTIQKNQTALDATNQTIKKYNSALAAAQAGNDDLAIIQLKKVVSLNPHFVRAQQLLALLYIHDKDYHKAANANRARQLTLIIRQHCAICRKLVIALPQRRVSEKAVKERPSFECNPVGTYKEEKRSLMPVIYVIIGAIVGLAVAFVLLWPTMKNSGSGEGSHISDTNDQLAVQSSQISGLKKEKELLQEQVDKLQKQIKDADSSAQKQTASYEKLLTGVKAYLADDKIQAAIAVADCKKSDFGSSEAKEIYTTIHTVTDAQIQALLNEGKRTAYTSYDGAIAIYRNVLKLKPKHQDAMYQIGYCYQKKQDNKKAKKWYRKAIKVDPNSAIANKANNYLQQIEQQGTQGQ